MAANARANPGPQGRGQRPNVLVVEDEALVRLVVVEELASAGFIVQEAETARAALRLAQEAANPVHAAIIDVGLPDERGDAVAAALRARWPEVVIVMVSGYDEDVLRDRFAGDLRVAFLRKPYLTNELLAVLRRLGITADTAAVASSPRA